MQCSNGRRSLREIDERLACAAGRLAAVALAASDRRRSLSAVQVRRGSSTPQAVLALGPGAGRRRGRNVSRTALRSTPRNARIATAWKRSSAHFMRRAVDTFDDLLAGIAAGEIAGAVGQRRLSSSDWIDEATAERLGGGRLPDRARLVRFAAVGAGDVSTARRGVCRARRFVRELRRSAAIVRLGHSSAGRRADRRAVVLAMLAMRGLVQAAARVGRSGARDRVTLRRPSTRSGRWESICRPGPESKPPCSRE